MRSLGWLVALVQHYNPCLLHRIENALEILSAQNSDVDAIATQDNPSISGYSSAAQLVGARFSQFRFRAGAFWSIIGSALFDA
jgi:hypothetical protein